MVQAEIGVRDLAALGRNLHDSPSALLAQVRQRGADELDAAGEIGRNLMINLRIRDLFGRAEQPVARVAHKDIDPTQLTECVVHDRPDAGSVREVEHRDRQAAAVLRLQIGEGALTPCGAYDAIATSKEALRH